jgi:hypothetical protein
MYGPHGVSFRWVSWESRYRVLFKSQQTSSSRYKIRLPASEQSILVTSFFYLFHATLTFAFVKRGLPPFFISGVQESIGPRAHQLTAFKKSLRQCCQGLPGHLLRPSAEVRRDELEGVEACRGGLCRARQSRIRWPWLRP